MYYIVSAVEDAHVFFNLWRVLLQIIKDKLFSSVMSRISFQFRFQREIKEKQVNNSVYAAGWGNINNLVSWSK